MEAGTARHSWISGRSLFLWPLRDRGHGCLGADASVAPSLLSCGSPFWHHWPAPNYALMSGTANCV